MSDLVVVALISAASATLPTALAWWTWFRPRSARLEKKLDAVHEIVEETVKAKLDTALLKISELNATIEQQKKNRPHKP